MGTMLKVIEVLAESDKSWKDASENAILLAGNSVRNIQSVDIEDREIERDDCNNIIYRIKAKVSYRLKLNEFTPYRNKVIQEEDYASCRI